MLINDCLFQSTEYDGKFMESCLYDKENQQKKCKKHVFYVGIVPFGAFLCKKMLTFAFGNVTENLLALHIKYMNTL